MLYILLIIALILFDQISKWLVVKDMVEAQTFPVMEGFFHLTYVKNRGIAFGLFQGKIDIISIITLIVIVGLGIYFYRNRKTTTVLEKLAYSFILGGAIGNIIDRFYRGFVVDMMDFRGIWTYVFNLADVWINVGVILIILDMIVEHTKTKKENQNKI